MNNEETTPLISQNSMQNHGLDSQDLINQSISSQDEHFVSLLKAAADAIDNDHENESNTVTATGNIIPERQDDLDSTACALSKLHIN